VLMYSIRYVRGRLATSRAIAHQNTEDMQAKTKQ
jgi:hypothetical protein